MRRRIILIIAAIVVALGIGAGVAYAASQASSQAAGGENASALVGPTWTLTRLEVEGQMAKPASDRGAPTITFKAGRFNGFSGCNYYGGAYTAAGGHLTFSEMSMTLMACVNPTLTTDSDAMSFEATYLTGLSRITRYQVSGSTLTLSDSDGKVTMTFLRGA